MRSLVPLFHRTFFLAAGILLAGCNSRRHDVAPAPSASVKVENATTTTAEETPKAKAPYADMSPTLGTVASVPIRGRLVNERAKPALAETTPLQQASQDELKEVDFDVVLSSLDGKEIAKLGPGKSDNEGYFDLAFPLKEGTVVPGKYHVDIRVHEVRAGQTTVQLLASDYKGAVVRSDIDRTYLDTHFLQKRDMAKLLTQKAAERKTLPAMEKVYAALRAGASGKEDRPLVFVSGSPRFFKRTLEAKMEIDKVEQNGLLLKAFEEVAFTQLINLAPERIVPALKEQVGYKLGHLLRERLELPTQASEILLGDDSEADFAVYSIYHRLMAGELDGEAATKEMLRGGVDPSQTSELLTLATKVRATLNGFHPVKVMYINLTGTPNEELKVRDWPVSGLLREHRGAWPLILDLYEEGFVTKESVATVKARLLELGTTPSELDEAANAGVKSGFLDAKSTSL